ncbi:MAG: tripartite tricarboxylate transporter TctB family protein [Candidatus Methylomirabilia bacterium]
MRRIARGSLVEALFWLVFAGTAFAVTYRFDQPLLTYEFGPAGWPRALLVGMALAALGLLLSSVSFTLQRPTCSRDADAPPHWPRAGSGVDAGVICEPATAPPGKADLKTNLRRVTTFALPFAYVFAMDRVGFLLITPFFLAAYICLLGLRRWPTLVGVTAAIYCLVVLIFVKLLFTPLPQGVGFFHRLNGQYISLIR